MRYTGLITVLTLLAPVVLGKALPDSGRGGGDDGVDDNTSGGGGGAEDDDGGEGDITEDIPAACLDICTPVAVLKNDCIIQFGDNTNALTCFCTSTTIDVATVVPACATCIDTNIVDPGNGDLHDLIEFPQKCGF